MEEFSKNGRKLRPRRNFSASESANSHRNSRPFKADGSYGTGRSDRPYRPEHSDRPHRFEHSDRPYRSEHSDRPYKSEHSDRPFRAEHSDRPFRPGKPAEGRRPFNGKPGFSGKPGFKKDFRRKDNAPRFSRESDEGINRMISRKPLVDDRNFSDNDTFHGTFEEEVRLNKFIANSGVCSRREADTFIQAGVVTVNGEVVTELGTKVNVLKDEVKFNGERLKGEEKVYIVMNKPIGYVTTASDPHAEKTVMDLLKGCKYRVFPVGRLDKNTSGVLMFTNDGEIAERFCSC